MLNSVEDMMALKEVGSFQQNASSSGIRWCMRDERLSLNEHYHLKYVSKDQF